MADLTYRGVLIEDVWPAGARRPGSQTRHQQRRREDGSQRWRVALTSGGAVFAFTQREAMAAVRLLTS